MQIHNDTVVAFRYIMQNAKGDVLENTMQSAPVNYLHGATSILVLLQKQMEGLKAGDKKEVYLWKENGADDDFVFTVIIDDVRDALSEEKQLGYPIHITENTCNDDCFCYSTTS